MDLLELQISFQQKIEDVNPMFEEKERPDTYQIVNTLNKSIMRYLRDKYVNLPSYELRMASIANNEDELRQLITTDYVLENSRALLNFNWGNRGVRYRTPDNVLVPYSLAVVISRSTIYPMSVQRVFAMFVNRKQAEKLVSNTSNKVMFDKILAVWEDPYYVMIVGDAYVTSISLPYLTYLKKPFELSFDYQELTASTQYGDLDITIITDGTYFLMKSYSRYKDADGDDALYKPGDKVQKIAGFNTIYNYPGTGEQVKVGYPWGYTDTPEFPEYFHEQIVDMAVQIFLDEAKLKLIPKTK